MKTQATAFRPSAVLQSKIGRDSLGAGIQGRILIVNLSQPTTNNAGQVAFASLLTGPNVYEDNDFGIFAEDRSGVLRLVVRTGSMFDVDDGPDTDFQTVDFFLLNGFNSMGQLAFWATFTDGTEGIFVSNIATIPEPSALLLGALAVAGMLVRRRRL